MRWLAVMVAVLMVGCSSDSSEPATETTQPVETTTAAVTTDTTPWAERPIRWERVDPAPGTLPSGMANVVTGGPGLVAVGGDGSGGDFDAAVWTSIDGHA